MYKINGFDFRKDQQRCAQMVDHLMQENNSLKAELEACYHRVAQAHKVHEIKFCNSY